MEDSYESEKIVHLVRSPLNFLSISFGSFTLVACPIAVVRISWLMNVVEEWGNPLRGMLLEIKVVLVPDERSKGVLKTTGGMTGN